MYRFWRNPLHLLTIHTYTHIHTLKYIDILTRNYPLPHRHAHYWDLKMSIVLHNKTDFFLFAAVYFFQKIMRILALMELNSIDNHARDLLGFSWRLQRELCTTDELHTNINICPFIRIVLWLNIQFVHINVWVIFLLQFTVYF